LFENKGGEYVEEMREFGKRKNSVANNS